MQATTLLEQKTDIQTDTDRQMDRHTDGQRSDPFISLIIQHDIDCKHALTYCQLSKLHFLSDLINACVQFVLFGRTVFSYKCFVVGCELVSLFYDPSIERKFLCLPLTAIKCIFTFISIVTSPVPWALASSRAFSNVAAPAWYSQSLTEMKKKTNLAIYGL